MARITVEDCLNQVDNRFQLIHVAAKRVRQLKKDAEPLVLCKNKDIVVALREIAAAKVYQIRREGEDSQVDILPESSLAAVLEGPLTEETSEEAIESHRDENEGEAEEK